MSTQWDILTVSAGLGAAASGGAFLTYSTFTTAALRHLPDAEAMTAMQQINVAAPHSASFMALVFAPGLLSLVAGCHAVLERHPGSAHVLVGAGIYLVGVVGMTMVFHIPRNDALATLNAVSQHHDWQKWLDSWVMGNHVRTLSALAAGGLHAWSAVRGYGTAARIGDILTCPTRKVPVAVAK